MGRPLARDLRPLLERCLSLSTGPRLARAYSQEGLAEAAKLERAYVGMIERGETNVSVRSAFRLARALDMTLAELFAGWSRVATAGGKSRVRDMPYHQV